MNPYLCQLLEVAIVAPFLITLILAFCPWVRASIGEIFLISCGASALWLAYRILLDRLPKR